MNTKKIAKALRNDTCGGLCEGSLCRYDVLAEGEREVKIMGCLVGSLLFSLGFSNYQLAGMEAALEIPLKGSSVDLDLDSPEAKAREALKREFGIEDHHITALIQVNDSLDHDVTPEARLAYVVGFLEGAPADVWEEAA